MSMIVEDGTGIFEADSYVGLSFAHSYLHKRNRNAAWDALSDSVKEASLVAATDYIDKRFGTKFLGTKKFLEISVSASNFMQFSSNLHNNDSIIVGSTTITFVNGSASTNQVSIGADLSATIANLVAFNHSQVSFSTAGSSSVLIKNKLTGEQPEISTISNSIRISFDYDYLVGGSDSEEQSLEWPREGVYSKSGTPIKGIPVKLKQAVVEYASRASIDKLMPDPTFSESGKDIRRQFEKVGPIETETTFSSTYKSIFKTFPEADYLLLDLINSSGGVYR